jgi:hypothetical protein
MNKQQKTRKTPPGKIEVMIYLGGETLEWLEQERKRRGGKENGIKLQPIIHEKLNAQMRAEREQC